MAFAVTPRFGLFAALPVEIAITAALLITSEEFIVSQLLVVEVFIEVKVLLFYLITGYLLVAHEVTFILFS